MEEGWRGWKVEEGRRDGGDGRWRVVEDGEDGGGMEGMETGAPEEEQENPDRRVGFNPHALHALTFTPNNEVPHKLFTATMQISRMATALAGHVAA